MGDTNSEIPSVTDTSVTDTSTIPTPAPAVPTIPTVSTIPTPTPPINIVAPESNLQTNIPSPDSILKYRDYAVEVRSVPQPSSSLLPSVSSVPSIPPRYWSPPSSPPNIQLPQYRWDEDVSDDSRDNPRDAEEVLRTAADDIDSTRKVVMKLLTMMLELQNEVKQLREDVKMLKPKRNVRFSESLVPPASPTPSTPATSPLVPPPLPPPLDLSYTGICDVLGITHTSTTK